MSLFFSFITITEKIIMKKNFCKKKNPYNKDISESVQLFS